MASEQKSASLHGQGAWVDAPDPREILKNQDPALYEAIEVRTQTPK